jgi:hypothetical protein
VVVFLRKADDSEAPTGWVLVRGPAAGLSVGWIAGGSVYVKKQAYDPGPLRLVRYGDLDQFKRDVRQVVDRRDALYAVIAEPDPGVRALRLRPYIDPHGVGSSDAGRALLRTGNLGVRALGLALENRLDPNETEWTIRALNRFGEPAQPVLMNLLRAELKYWAAAADGLGPNWQVTDPVAARHLTRLQWALVSPDPYRKLSNEDRQVIVEIRRLWVEHPTLAVKPRPGGHPAIRAARLLERLDR